MRFETCKEKSKNSPFAARLRVSKWPSAHFSIREYISQTLTRSKISQTVLFFNVQVEDYAVCKRVPLFQLYFPPIFSTVYPLMSLMSFLEQAYDYSQLVNFLNLEGCGSSFYSVLATSDILPVFHKLSTQQFIHKNTIIQLHHIHDHLLLLAWAVLPHCRQPAISPHQHRKGRIVETSRQNKCHRQK
jgi:hypothetical protein